MTCRCRRSYSWMGGTPASAMRWSRCTSSRGSGRCSAAWPDGARWRTARCAWFAVARIHADAGEMMKKKTTRNIWFYRKKLRDLFCRHFSQYGDLRYLLEMLLDMRIGSRARNILITCRGGMRIMKELFCGEKLDTSS